MPENPHLNAGSSVAEYESAMRSCAESLFQLLDSAFEGNWKSSVVGYRQCNQTSEIAFTTFDPEMKMLPDLATDEPGGVLDGQTLWFRDHFKDELGTLRQTMWNPVKGAWFSMRVKVTDVGGCKYDFEYTELPGFEAHVTDADWIADNAVFPRTPTDIPRWHPAFTD